MAATRLETKHRPTKRPMANTTFDIFDGSTTVNSEPARMPRLDHKGYGTKGGVPDPTLVTRAVVDTTPPPPAPTNPTGGEMFDPGDNTIAQVQAYIEGLGDEEDQAVIDETQRVLDLERAGQNRVTLVDWLDSRDGVV